MKKIISGIMILPALIFSDATSNDAGTPNVIENLQENKTVSEEIIKNSQTYVSLGVGPLPVPLPVFGLGGRFQNGHHGFDMSLQLATVVSVTALKENLSYLYYFNPSLISQFYAGGGLGFTEVFLKHENPKAFVSPQFVFGKEYTSETGGRRFFQTQIDFPFFKMNDKIGSSHSIGKYPSVVLSYGICF